MQSVLGLMRCYIYIFVLIASLAWSGMSCSPGSESEPQAPPPFPAPTDTTGLSVATAASQVTQGQSIGNEPPLVSARVDTGPVVDGRVDVLWDSAVPLLIPLEAKPDGQGPGRRIEMRSVYTADRVYFLARWPEDYSEDVKDMDVITNKFTVLWKMGPEPGRFISPGCAKVCHTGWASGVKVNQMSVHGTLTSAEGSEVDHVDVIDWDSIAVAGAWADGAWIVEWGRRLDTGLWYDVRLANLTRTYYFAIMVFGLGHPASLEWYSFAFGK